MNDKGFIQQLEKKYKDYLKKVIAEIPFEIIELRGGKNRPETTRQLAEDIELFQKFEKKDGMKRGWTIEWEDWNSKKLGKQKWPTSIKIETEDDYLFLIKKETEVIEFKKQLSSLVNWRNEIRSFFLDRPHYILQYKEVWKELCSVVDYLLKNNVSGHYIRSIPVPVHTKFIEQHKALIYELIKQFSPDINSDEILTFESALKLRTKQHLYTFRWLDNSLSDKYMYGHEIFGLSTTGLRKLDWNVREIWFVENETNLYLLPARMNALVVFSRGHALTQLFDIPLLRNSKLIYWGDLDEHGFIMLNSFKQHYKHAVSIFMDKVTVEYHQNEMLKQPEKYKVSALEYLNDEEHDAFQILYDANGRIEQERLNLEFVNRKLETMK